MKKVHAGPAESQRAPFRADEWLTRREVAARLKKTERTIDSYIRTGCLPAVRIGGSILLRWSDVERRLTNDFRIRPRPLTRARRHRPVQFFSENSSVKIPNKPKNKL